MAGDDVATHLTDTAIRGIKLKSTSYYEWSNKAQGGLV